MQQVYVYLIFIIGICLSMGWLSFAFLEYWNGLLHIVASDGQAGGTLGSWRIGCGLDPEITLPLGCLGHRRIAPVVFRIVKHDTPGVAGTHVDAHRVLFCLKIDFLAREVWNERIDTLAVWYAGGVQLGRYQKGCQGNQTTRQSTCFHIIKKKNINRSIFMCTKVI